MMEDTQSKLRTKSMIGTRLNEKFAYFKYIIADKPAIQYWPTALKQTTALIKIQINKIL